MRELTFEEVELVAGGAKNPFDEAGSIDLIVIYEKNVPGPGNLFG